MATQLKDSRILRKTVLVAAWALCSGLIPGSAQAASSVAYQISAPTAAPYVALTGGTVLNGVDRYTGARVDLPFPVQFYGTSYSSVVVSLHGYAAFMGDDSETFNYGIPHAVTYAPTTFIAPWWDSLTVSSTTQLRHQTTGVPPSRVWTLEWRDVAPYDTNVGKFSFQLKIYESTSQIRFAYGSTTPNSAGASVGIQGKLSDGLSALGCTTSSTGACKPTDFPINSAIDVFLPPDLQISSVAGEETGYAGVSFRTSAVVRNTGGRDAKNVRVRFHLSTDAKFDGADPVIGTSDPLDLAFMGERLVSALGTIPGSATPGSYFIFGSVDPDGAITELDDTNNVSLPSGATVGSPTPDLMPASISAPTDTKTPGSTINLDRTIVNRGNAAVTVSTKYTYFLSDNAVVSLSDRVLGTAKTLATLAAGATSTVADSVVLPSDLTPGRFWVGVCVDYDASNGGAGTVAEISEVNNCAAAPGGFVVDTGTVAVLTRTLPGASQYAPYGLHLEAAGGTGEYVWSLSAGLLPPGMALAKNGDLLGTPSGTGSFSFEAKVTSGTNQATAQFSLSVTDSKLPLAIVDQDLPSAEVGRAYEAFLVAVGGKPPYVWTLKADTRLPLGLALSADGRIEGRAAEVAEVPFSVELRDSSGTQAAKDLRLRAVTPTALRVASTALSTAFLGREYLQPLRAAGGSPPYQWSVLKFQKLAETPFEKPEPVRSAFPPNFGILVQPDDSGGSSLSGVPSSAGLFALTLRLQDNAGNDQITTIPFRVSYENALALMTTALPDAFSGQAYQVKLTHNGSADDSVQFSIPCAYQVDVSLRDWTCQSLPVTQQTPPGVTLNPDGTLSGIPGDLSDDKPLLYTFMVKVTDNKGRQDLRSLSIKLRNDFEPKGKGCSGTGLPPSALLMGVAALALRLGRRRQG
jgi:hypothetical protein